MKENSHDSTQWHDCKVYAIAFFDEAFELALDIDYISDWIEKSEPKPHYQFLVSPATLVFRNVYDLEIYAEILDFRIDQVLRSIPATPKNIDHIAETIEYDWRIEGHNGVITFKSVGCELFVRRAPHLTSNQTINFKQRGGICFDKSDQKVI